MTLGKQDSIAARSAISRGDLTTLERYLREGGANPDTISVTSATVALNRSEHGGRTVVFNRAAGVTATLPPATGSQDRYSVMVGTALSGSGIVKVANAQDSIAGSLTMATTALGASTAQAAPTDSDTITMNGGTSGGSVGSTVVLTDAAPNLWIVAGNLIHTGTSTTPFSNGV